MNEAIDLAPLVKAHAWWAVAAVVIGLVVRAMRSDTSPLALRVPPFYRPWIALGLGQLSAALNALAAGAGWRDAVIGGLASTAVALLVAGSEPPSAGAGGGNSSASPNSSSPPSNVVQLKREWLAQRDTDRRQWWALSAAFGLPTVVLLVVLGPWACTPAERQEARTVIDTVITDDQYVCVMEHGMKLETVSPEVAIAVAAQCDIAPAFLAFVERLLGNAHVAAMRAATARLDAGAPDAANDNARRPAAGYR